MEKLLYALQDNQLVSINDVPSGQNCNCICPACKQPLVAKKGNILIHHFAHARNSDCKYGYETSLHLLAKEIISNATYITLPKVTFGSYSTLQILESRQVKIKDVKCELFLDNIKPDIIIDTEEGKIIIEIYVTHKVDDNKLKKIRNLGIDSIEIDLSKQKELVDRSLLTNILLEDNPLKNWIFNKKQESVKEDLILKKSMLGKCTDQWKNNPKYKNKPSWVYCISECEYFLDNIDDEKFYCKKAQEIKESPVFCKECGCIMNLEYGKFGAYYACTGCSRTESSP